MGLEIPLWRAVAVFRIAAFAYAVVLLAQNHTAYPHPIVGWVVIGVMGAWTAFATWAYAEPSRRGWPLLLADLTLTGSCLFASRWVIDGDELAAGAATVPMAWVASPVLAWAISGGRRRGAIAALAMGGVDLATRGVADGVTINGTVLLLLAGVTIGYVARLAVEAETRLQEAVRIESVNRERERLARSIHDSVLQVLALVQRRGTELGGEAAELGRLAGEQEATLRSLVGLDPGPSVEGAVDLRTLISRYSSGRVSVAAPATPVPLPGHMAEELAAAVGSAIANVHAHAGPDARAWVLIEDEGDAVTVSVRDDGTGMPAGRLDEAAVAGRLGVAQSIRGRLRDLGGAVWIDSEPGKGTEVEMSVPRTAS